MTRRLNSGLVLLGFLWVVEISYAQPAGTAIVEPNGRRVYVPLEELDQVVSGDKQGVILSRDEFAKLSALAQKQSDAFPPTTHAIVATKAEYSAEIVDTQLVLTAIIEFTQLKPGWQTLTLPFRNVAIERVALDDKPAQMGREGVERTLVLFSAEAGRHKLSLKLSTSLASLGSDRVAALGLAPVPAASLRLPLPAGQYLYADDVALERHAPADQTANYVLAVGGRSELNLRIAGRQAQQQSASLVFASTAIGLKVAAEVRRWRAVSTINVFGKPIDSLRFIIPSSLDIVSVESAGLERWEIAAGPSDGTTALNLVYRQPISDSRGIVFQGVSTGGLGESWSVPTLGLTGAASHLVRVVIHPSAELRLHPVTAAGVRRITADDAPRGEDTPPDPAVQDLAGTPQHYAAWNEGFSLEFVTRPRSRELQATIATRVDANSHELGLRSSIAVRSRFAPLFDLDLSLPVDWSVQDVLIGEQPARWRVVPVDAGNNQIQVSFQPPVPPDGKVELTLMARRIPGENWPIGTDPVEFPLPEVHLPEVGVTDGRYMIAADDDLELTIDGMTGLDPVRLSDAEQQLARAPRLVYEYQDARFQGKLIVTRRPLRLAAQTLAFYRLDRESQRSHLEARLAVQGGGLQKLELALPESAGSDLRFRLVDHANRSSSLPEIIEQTSAPPAAGERIWTLRFDQRVFGLLWLAVDLQTPRAADSKEFSLPVLRIVGAERQSGQIAIEAGPDQQLKLTAIDSTGQPLAEFDPADLSTPADYRPQDRIVAAFQAVRAGYRITAAETRFDRQAVPTAICDKSILTTVVSQSGELQHQAEFHLRATGVQGLRFELPAEAVLWATLLDGQPMEARAPTAPEGELPGYVVPLPPLAQPTAVRKLKLLYRTSAGGLQSSGALRQTPPRLSVVSGQGELQPLEILERDWILFHSGRTEITSSSGQFAPVERPVRWSLLGRLQESLRLGGARDLALKGLAVAAAVIVIGALWLSFRRRGSSGFVTTLAVGVCLLILATLILPATQSAREAAERSQAPSTTLQIVRATPDAEGMEIMGGTGGGFGAHEAPAPQSAPKDGAAGEKDEPSLQQFRSDGVDGAKSVGARSRRSGPRRNESGKTNDSIEGDNRNGNLSDDSVAFQNQQEPPLDDGVGGALGAQAPQDDPAKPNPKEGRLGKGMGGERPGALLSLAINLEPGPDSRTATFHYAGAPASGVEPVLAIELQDRRRLSITALAWQAGVLLLFWFARHWSPGMRATLAVVGLIGPLALVPIVPLETLPYLDGLFVGSVWGVLLWTVLVLLDWRECCVCPWSRRSKPSAASAALFIACTIAFLTASPVSADPLPNSALRTPRSPPTTLLLPTTTAQPLESRRILLPFEQFLELWRAAHPELEVERGAPRDGVVAEALYAAEFVPAAAGTKPSIAITGRYAIHNFRSGQITLPLPLGKVSLRAATLDGKAAPIISRQRDDVSELAIVVPETGPHVVDVQFSIPAEQTGPSGRFVLPLQPTPTGTLHFTMPAADQTLKVTGSSGAFRRLREGEKTIAVIPIDRGGEIGVAWAPLQSREAAEGIIHAQSRTALRFDDDGMHVTARIQYTVRQGIFSEAGFTLPPGLLVRRISGLDLGGWETAGEGDQRSLKVFLSRPVNDATTLEFDLFQPQTFSDQPQAISAPQFVPQGVTRETGLVGIFAPGHLSLSAGAAVGLSQIDVAQFAASPGESPTNSKRAGGPQSTSPQLAYRFSARPFQLPLQVVRQKPVSKGVAEHACHVGIRKLRLVSRLELQIVGAPRSEIAIQLPVGYLLYDVKSPAVADYFVDTSADGQPPILRIDLATPRTGAVELILDGMLPRAEEDLLPLVGVPFPLGLGDLRSSLAVWLDRSFSASFEGLEGWKSIDPEQLPARLRQARQTAAQLAFSSSATTVPPIVLDLTRAASRLSASALSVVMVRDTSVQLALYLRWNVALAGETRFVFTTPDWLADRLDFDRKLPGVRIRQVISEAIDQKRLRWTVILEEPREKVLLLSAQAVLPPPENGRITAPLVTFEQVVPADNGAGFSPLDNQKQQLLLVNQSPQRLDRDAPEGAVERISASDLSIRVGTEISNRAAEILAVKNPQATVGWQVQPGVTLKALPASVNVSRMTLVVEHDGSWRAQADYRINNRSRQFLAVRLPAKSRTLSLFVADRPARPIRPDRPDDPDVILIPLPKTALGDLSAEVRLTFEGQLSHPLPRGVQVLRNELDLPAPQVLSQNEDPEFGAPVAATEWTVILPNDIDAARIDDPARSNLAASSEGAEQLIAAYQELLNLASVASEAKSRNNYRQYDRAAYNLKRLGRTIAQDDPQRMPSLSTEERQSRQLVDLQQKWLAAQREIAALKGTEKAASGEAAPESGSITRQDLQRDILTNNSIDFVPDSQRGESDDFRIDFDHGVSDGDKKPAGGKSAPKSADRRKSARNRADLKDETTRQSISLNGVIAAQQPSSAPEEAGRRSQVAGIPARRLAGALDQPSVDNDADSVLDFFEDERYSKVPLVDQSEDESQPARDKQKRNAGQPNQRASRAMAGVPILNKPTFIGGLFGQQLDMDDLARGRQAEDAAVPRDDIPTTAWAQPGGLSLEIAIPQFGQKLTFSKPGGDARLALGLRPKASRETGMGLVWTVVWLVVALGLIAALGRNDAVQVLQRRLPLGLTIVGLLWYILLPAALLGFVLFVLGLAGMARQHRRA